MHAYPEGQLRSQLYLCWCHSARLRSGSTPRSACSANVPCWLAGEKAVRCIGPPETLVSEATTGLRSIASSTGSLAAAIASI